MASGMASAAGTNSNTRSYDPNIIIRAANDKLSAGDLAGGQILFQTALLNWVDDAREGIHNHNPNVDSESLKEAIATLWISYAQFLMSAKQFRSATEAFEQAVDCPVGGTVGRVWLEYVRFLVDRNKPRTAQQVYLRALISNKGGPAAVRDEQDRSLLWQEFLELSRQTSSNPDLTLAELQRAIQEEQQQQQSIDEASNAPASKRPRLEGSMPGYDPTGVKQESDVPVSRTHVVTSSDVELEIQTLTEALQSVPNDPTFMAAWLVRDGDAPPQPPQPALFEAAPPKLSDPTGKDLLGEDLALAVVTRLLEPSGGVVLQTCRALWMWALLKEQQSGKAVETMDATIKEEYLKLQARLDERLSVAGAAEAAVRTMNTQELRAFEAKARDERQALLNKIAWELRQLQWASQQVLNKLRMPGFVRDASTAGTTVDANELGVQARVCAYLHSAFFLRKRIREDAHVAMLKSQKERLEQMVASAPSAAAAPPYGARTPPRTHSPVPPMGGVPQYGGVPPPPPPPQYGIPPPPPPPPMGYPVAPGAYGIPPPPQPYGQPPQQQPPPQYPPQGYNPPQGY